jgi:hypothetical protein
MSNDSLIAQNNCVNFAGSHLCCGFFVAVRAGNIFLHLLLPTLNLSFYIETKSYDRS